MARNDPQVNFRMPAELKDKLEAAAKESGRSTTAEIISRLENTFGVPSPEFIVRTITKLEYDLARERVRCCELRKHAAELGLAVRVFVFGDKVSWPEGVPDISHNDLARLVNRVTPSGGAFKSGAGEKEQEEDLEKARRAYFKIIEKDFE